MDEKQRRETLALLEKLRHDLRKMERQILEYSPYADDEPFLFLLRKAGKYRDWIAQLEKDLNGF